jgi:hypothetical protein
MIPSLVWVQAALGLDEKSSLHISYIFRMAEVAGIGI